MTFSDDALQFADATIERYNRAERKCMRRLIQSAPLHNALKYRLLEHSASVQFTDKGREVPSIPILWMVEAIEQFGPSWPPDRSSWFAKRAKTPA
jgi:hypothetical protein